MRAVEQRLKKLGLAFRYDKSRERQWKCMFAFVPETVIVQLSDADRWWYRRKYKTVPDPEYRFLIRIPKASLHAQTGLFDPSSCEEPDLITETARMLDDEQLDMFVDLRPKPFSFQKGDRVRWQVHNGGEDYEENKDVHVVHHVRRGRAFVTDGKDGSAYREVVFHSATGWQIKPKPEDARARIVLVERPNRKRTTKPVDIKAKQPLGRKKNMGAA